MNVQLKIKKTSRQTRSKVIKYFPLLERKSRPLYKQRTAGTPGAIRTRDLPLRRRTLYPAELRKHICGAYLFYPIRRAKSTEICAAFPGGCLRQAFPRLFGLKSPRSACPGAFCPGLFCAAPAPAAGAKSSVLPKSFPAPPQDAALLASCLSSLSEPTVGRRHKAF